MENTEFNYFLREKIKNIFENCHNSNFSKNELIKNDIENIDSKKSECFKYIYTDKINENDNYNYSRIHKKIFNDEKNRYLKYDQNYIFSSNKKYLIIENYTSVIYENCEEKANVILANKNIPEGRIEIQIKGKESFIVPCCINGNILSFFLPNLEKGIYQLFFFINKEMMFIKLLRSGLELSEDSKSLPLHVIEITDFGYCLKKKNRKNKTYNLSLNNNIYTNKELIKLYHNIYKKYSEVNNENIRYARIAVGNDYKLQNTSESKFYNFLRCYKDEFIDHTFRRNKNKIDINNMNFISQLNLEKETEQSRIPILYKRLLYDHCIYENKMIIMHFHSKIFEYDPFNVLSAHIFTKNQLKEGYTIFAFNLIPVFQIENKKKYSYNEMDTIKDVEENNSFNMLNDTESRKENKRKAESYMSTLLMLNSDETNCADIRMWNYLDTIVCKKNNISNNFYISKNNCEDINCPIPIELINNKNVFKKYSEGLKISEKVSIFFENWNEDILPVQKFVNFYEYNLPYKKIDDLSKFIKNRKKDFLVFNDFYQKNDENEKKNHSVILGENYSPTKKSITNENQNNNEYEKKQPFEYLFNNFVSFVIVVEGKIYHSVIPINKLLLLFIVNYWMHFVSMQKKIKEEN